MITHKQKIGMVIYANPDYYPPAISAIHILAKEFDLVVFCRNQNKPQIDYPSNVKLYRLGKLKTVREKETQGLIVKFLEYISFATRVIFYTRFYGCQLIYSYDMHGFITGFLVSCFDKKMPLIYHNLDLCELEKKVGLSYIIKYLELRLARYADRIVFPDINRAKFFQGEAKLDKLPDIVINTPLCINQLPSNRLKALLEEKGFVADTKIVLYQGAINEAHSILEVIKSMVFWPKDTILVLCGIQYKDFMERLYREVDFLNLRERIIILPFIPYSELFSFTVGAYMGLALFNSKDINQIFVAGASNKIFEYLSLGIPVITNDSPYFREVLDSSVAYFAKPDSVEDIARAVNSAFFDVEEYRRKSQAARQAHLSKLNYEEQFKSIVEYIREVTKR